MSSLHYHLLHVGRSVGTMDLHDIHTPHRTFELHAVQQNPEEETCLSTHFLLSPHWTLYVRHAYLPYHLQKTFPKRTKIMYFRTCSETGTNNRFSYARN
mgnify:CR=1 FL=1